MNIVSDAFLAQKSKSKSARVRSLLNYPVIDTDIHTIDFAPLLEDYIAKYGGVKLVDQVRAHLKDGLTIAASEWYGLSPDERRNHRLLRPPFWALPASNTKDLATALLPKLLYERLEEQGSDFAILYPNITLFPLHSQRDDLRRVLARAINHYNADIYRPYADRFTPVAVIPLHTPQEGIEELEFAVQELGLKTAIIPGAVRRPIKALTVKYPLDKYPELARHLQYLDFLALDSEYDYDPFWARTIELGVNPTTHSAGMSWSARNSPSNYMFNHIGHFADASEALAKALFFGGVTRRFPNFRIALLEGGAAWGANVYTHLVDRWLKRGRDAVQKYNPANIDIDTLRGYFTRYGSDLTRGKDYSKEELLQWVYGIAFGQGGRKQNPREIDDFALAGIESVEDIRDRYIPNFYFGNEADDRTVAHAFNTRATPLNAQVNTIYSSDAGHWDVPEFNTTLADTWQLVEDGAISAENFKQLVFSGPYNFYTANNPGFFQGTAVETRLQAIRKSAEQAKDSIAA
jgi:predicted TIM-barrel fold metal-dependent hydrolase